MKTIFVTGTAGSGKSSLVSKLYEYYTRNGAFAATLNLDPGVESMPYNCDVDVRDYVDYVSIMQEYNLGPNGGLVMANDLIASKIDEIQNDVNNINPDYLIVDTPGQIELFAYRSSGRFIIDQITSDEKASIFLFDGSIITTPVNFVSIALLATSIRLRLNLPTINAITKTDVIDTKLKDILQWSTNTNTLENAISNDTDGETYSLTTSILRGLNLSEFEQGLIPISNLTGDGIVNLEWRTKMNSIGGEVLEGIQKSIEISEKNYKGLVIANQGSNFSVGANIAMIFMMAIEQEYEEIDFAVRAFQNTTGRIRNSSIPVVVATHGMTLGGGCEIALHADHVQASAETYIGLVEMGVGVIPGGGGTKEMAKRASQASSQETYDYLH